MRGNAMRLKEILALLALGLAAPLWAQVVPVGGGGSSSAGVTSPVTTDPLSFTGAVTGDNVANTPATWRDGLVVGPAATTGDANADSVFTASATTKAALLLEAKATPTKSPFIVQSSAGVHYFEIQSDGGLILDQRTGATYSTIASFKYQGTEQFGVGFSGTATARVGFNGGGGNFTTDISGNVVSLGTTITGRHLIANGTSPTLGGSCGTSPSIAGKDGALKITTGTGSPTSCVVTFGTAWTTAPVCVANAATTTTALNIATTTTTATVSAAALTASEVLHVVCHGF